ncbi:class III lanthionine synthetase LanKC [Luteimonas sp. Y-2-2-4F]|nr:class III lanthionine synthetase LanKC [Luteimonas sp. Y-2-2-4F]MCD9030381.1 class III lanthionine synthetase LanKC [Luteimonas sp. Y-2-2-4F]
MLHTLANKKFFEDIENIGYSEEFEQLLKPLLPDGWETRLSGVWLHARHPRHRLPEQGFKIHLSTTPSDAADVIRAASAVCFGRDTCFKVSRDPLMLSIMNSKHYPRGNAGKLMTIYPVSETQFRALIDEVHEATKHFNGPYILSDRRYARAGVVYYRYGEILSQAKMTVAGYRQSQLSAPDGSAYKEVRLPYYRLPPWVSEPFPPEPQTGGSGNGLIGGRYRVEKALAFSNGGGIYLGKDTVLDRDVVLKEARPYTAQFQLQSGDIDAFRLLEHERSVLGRLEGVSGVVGLQDFFAEWEHRFLVEEYFEGIPLRRYRARNDFNLLPFDGDRARADRYCDKIARIFVSLIETILQVHARGVVIADLSPSNILVNPESLEVRIIDFEGAVVDQGILPEEFAARWATQGFKHERREASRSVSQDDDWYALGMVLFSTILPMQELFDFEISNKELFLDILCQSAALPPGVAGAIRCLWKSDASGAADHLRALETGASAFGPEGGVQAIDASLDEQVPEIVEGIDRFVDVTCDPGRQDRLWPSDPEVFATNPLSIAYGACGPLLYKILRGTEITAEQKSWFLAAIERHDDLPPGLYIGRAGVACLLFLLGEHERALQALGAACTSGLLGEDPGLFHGDAGVVQACLLARGWILHDGPLDWACAIADRLVESASTCEGGVCWSSAGGGKRQLGLAFGGSGVAMALLGLGKATDRIRYVEVARAAMEAELASAFERDGHLVWGADTGSVVSEPYWLHGGSGVGSALVRFHAALGETRYLDLAAQVARSSYSRFTVHPGQFEGMSGIGEFMLDMHRATGDAAYLDRAKQLARSICLYRVNGQQSIGYLGRGLQRLSCDYGYGAAGVGCFLHRLKNGGPRALHDLPIASRAP